MGGVWFLHSFTNPSLMVLPLLPYSCCGEKIGISNHLLLINIVDSFIISELTRVRCYWGKKLLRLQMLGS